MTLHVGNKREWAWPHWPACAMKLACHYIQHGFSSELYRHVGGLYWPGSLVALHQRPTLHNVNEEAGQTQAYGLGQEGAVRPPSELQWRAAA